MKITVRNTNVSQSSSDKYPVDYEFMRSALEGSAPAGPEQTYDTIRLESERIEGSEHTSVHVYEYYWSDLSRLTGGVFRILGELYQLLLHVPSIGHVALRAARRTEGGSNPLWGLYVGLQRVTSRILTRGVPVVNLLMVWLAALAVVVASLDLAPDQVQPLVVAALWSLLLGFGVAFAIYSRNKAPTAVPWTLLGLTSFALPFLVWAVVEPFQSDAHVYAFAVSWSLILTLLFGAVIRRLERSRGEFRTIGWGLLLIVLGLLGLDLYDAWYRTTLARDVVLQAVLTVLSRTYFLGVIAWLAFGILFVMSFLFGLGTIGTAVRKNLMARAWWTNCLTTSIPAIVFVLLTFAIWGSIIPGATKLMPCSAFAIADIPWYSWLNGTAYSAGLDLESTRACSEAQAAARAKRSACAAMEKVERKRQGCDQPAELEVLKKLDAGHASDWVERLLQRSMGGVLSWLAAFVLALTLAAWAIAPIVTTEVRLPQENVPRWSKTIGTWLNNAYRFLYVPGAILVVAVLAQFPAFLILRFTGGQLPVPEYNVQAGVILTLLALSLRYIPKLRTVIDVVLDVDSHLRLHPESGTPRALMAARYASLFRALCEKTNGRPLYDAIVIVAHSQGAVITADLLRFLQVERERGNLEPALEPLGTGIPVYFFTMGCPVRQLYAARFPYLYEYARHSDVGDSSWLENDLQKRQPRPDPRTLGVAKWYNAFRSGDYIGRHLWRTDVCSYNFDTPGTLPSTNAAWERSITLGAVEPVSSSGDPVRVEFCIGPGGHTRYWGNDGAIIAALTDHLIVGTANLL